MKSLPWIIGLVLVVLLSACTAETPGPEEPDQPLDEVAAAVAAALTSGELAAAPITDPQVAQADYDEIRRGMDEVLPTVTAGEVRLDQGMGFVRFGFGWALPGGEWTYDLEAPFVLRDNRWLLQWGPTVVHPQLSADTRLVHTRTQAPRGNVVGRNSEVLMSTMPVLRLGIDKTRVTPQQAETSARQLADLLDVDADGFVDRVTAAGERAFVEALTVRTPRSGLPPTFGDIPGALAVDDEQVLAVEKGLAASVLGTAGRATKEVIDSSEGKVVAGDTVGLSGLQQRYDDQLRGTPGSLVRIVSRPPAPATSSPAAGSAAPSPASPTPASPAATPTPIEPVELFATDPVRGTDLMITLDLELQARADKIMGPVGPPAAMAVVQPSTGEVLVLSVSGSAKNQPLANFGRYAPGSTFKIVTALALLRAGLTPASPVQCPQTTVVDGRVIKNYDDFPPSRVGTMRLRDAIALSCNTAFVNERGRLSGPALREAAASLGMGHDHEAGFPAFYGLVPDPENVVGLAEASFGQGTVQASPMAMAGVAASVAAGRTTVPYLISDNRPSQPGKPLTSGEADQLASMMAAVVNEGSGRSLRGKVVGAKTGTAEYGTATPPATHAWMIAYGRDLAIAVMVHDGESGSGTAGPLISAFLG
ncbi:penicillin-binding transpeptidase domain-containing protein [Microlunatus sp. Y2014]|uniref:penicillin-binding transpeptidase domain-containing protein n=1 Tax=Microlunatus sp. Y2014 TaxID=3418488 RepID=UPI003DA7090F